MPELEQISNPPSPDQIKHYKRQIGFLKNIMKTECEPKDPIERNISVIPRGTNLMSEKTVPTIHQRLNTQTTNKLRQQLLGSGTCQLCMLYVAPESDSLATCELTSEPSHSVTSFCHDDDDIYIDSEENILRNRLSDSKKSETVENRLNTDERQRDALVEDVISMTREWKEQSKIASKVIKKDNETISTSSQMADSNETKLKVESNRLSEFASKTCSCWTWLMLLLICCMFIGMVMFIKIFPKRHY